MTRTGTILAIALSVFLASGRPVVSGERDAAALSSLEYLETGVGLEEREEQPLGFQAKLIFTNSKGEYLADVIVLIHKGGEVRAIHSGGPWFFLKGEPGIYEITAATGGLKASRSIVLPKRGMIGYILHLKPATAIKAPRGKI